MDIHKPKPWHGWRAFAKELLTIMLGVLMALGAEQVVEWSHRHHEMEQARAALRAEIADNLTTMVAVAHDDRCNIRFLDRYLAFAHGGPRPPPNEPLLWGMQSTVWDVVKAGAVPQMPLNERLGYARFYDEVATFNSMVERGRTFASVVGGYGAMARLTPADAHALEVEVAAFSGLLRTKAREESYFLGRGAQLGVKPGPLNAEAHRRLATICLDGEATL